MRRRQSRAGARRVGRQRALEEVRQEIERCRAVLFFLTENGIAPSSRDVTVVRATMGFVDERVRAIERRTR